MPTNTNKSEKHKSAMTPLWVISLFVSLTEVVTGIAVTQASGGVQIALTTFVIVFPLLVATGFFLILWHKPYVFYPPTEFGPDVNVENYVAAMHQRTKEESDLLSILRSTVDSSIRSPELMDALHDMDKDTMEKESNLQISDIVETVADKAKRDFEEQVLIIDTAKITRGEIELLYRPYHPTQFVSELLDGIYFELYKYIKAHTYDKKWILEDAKSGHQYRNIGTQWAEAQGQTRDFRSLSEIGIRAGHKLRVEFI